MKEDIKKKSNFFAIYFGQKVGFWTLNGREQMFLISSNRFVSSNVKGMTLALKSMKSITDEDAIDVAKIIAPEMNALHQSAKFLVDRSNDWLEVKTIHNKFSVDIDYDGIISKCVNDSDEMYRYNENIVHGIDYLRSKGYALPWMGISVKELVEMGWMELIE